MGVELFTKDTREQLNDVQLDEAQKRGTTSPGGVFALLGELDNYLLIENLIRGPVTDKQLTTPVRWWLFGKGAKLAGIVGMVLLLTRFALLVPGENMNHDVKFIFFLVIYAGMIFANCNMLMKYAQYPGGASWTAVKFALSGLSASLLFAESIKTAVFMIAISFRNYAAHHWYRKNAVSDVILELFYNEFARMHSEELIILLISWVTVGYFWFYFKKMTKYNASQLGNHQPYDLGIKA